ncbi:hypothetical protein CEXT_541151 [Caerostris extrusa]|uniref:Uncharacterized protein n=1 Tax=Caerostris extrusa TaxID=172846 RepID=A0AAV4RYQ7_CAEEX|nr:hypothetical protein CEXT_541151 [Caerostris extrusa]
METNIHNEKKIFRFCLFTVSDLSEGAWFLCACPCPVIEVWKRVGVGCHNDNKEQMLLGKLLFQGPNPILGSPLLQSILEEFPQFLLQTSKLEEHSLSSAGLFASEDSHLRVL